MHAVFQFSHGYRLATEMQVPRVLLVSPYVACSWLEVHLLDAATSPCEMGHWGKVTEASIVPVPAG